MNEEEKMVKRDIIFGAFVLAVLFVATFVFASHEFVTLSNGTNETVSEVNITTFYNVSIVGDVEHEANITQVNFTLPAGLIFDVDTSETDTLNDSFANTSTVISWSNTTAYLINGTTTNYFWFNATAVSLGNFNITVMTLNVTGPSYYNISLIVNDTANPTVTAINVPAANANVSGIFNINATVTDNVAVQAVSFNITNITNDQVNYTDAVNEANDWNYTFDTAQLTDGTFNITVVANDTTGNANSSEVVTITVDNIVPNVTLSAPTNNTSGETAEYNFTFNITDTNYVSTCSLAFAGTIFHVITDTIVTSTLNGMFNDSLTAGAGSIWSVNCTDAAGNVGTSEYRTLGVVTNATTTPASSGGGGGGGGSGLTLLPTAETLAVGYTVAVRASWDVEFDDNDGGEHVLTINSVSGSSVTITIASSHAQTFVLSIGETIKADADGNGNYDLLVRLESINQGRAKFFFQTINEIVPVAAPEVVEEEIDGGVDLASPEEPERGGLGAVWIIAILVIIALVIWFVAKNMKK